MRSWLRGRTGWLITWSSRGWVRRRWWGLDCPGGWGWARRSWGRGRVVRRDCRVAPGWRAGRVGGSGGGWQGGGASLPVGGGRRAARVGLMVADSGGRLVLASRDAGGPLVDGSTTVPVVWLEDVAGYVESAPLVPVDRDGL